MKYLLLLLTIVCAACSRDNDDNKTCWRCQITWAGRNETKDTCTSGAQPSNFVDGSGNSALSFSCQPR